MRLGVDEVGVTELMGVSEHTRALATAAAGLCLDSLDAERALVPPLDPSTAEEPAKALFEEIAAWGEAAMGRRAAPVLWRVLAHNPHYIEERLAREGRQSRREPDPSLRAGKGTSSARLV